MGIFQFNKELRDHISHVTVRLESLFQTVFGQMVYFRKELDRHTGTAAQALQQKMDDQIHYFSEASFGLMLFVDTVKSFIAGINTTDEGINGCAPPIATRAERQYTYSAGRVEAEIKLDPTALEQATSTFHSNLAGFEEILTVFHSLLNHIIASTDFPWGDVTEVWPEAQNKIQFVINEFKERVTQLIGDSENLVKELKRVDHLLSNQMQRVKKGD